jgi:hypothetical protein
MKRELSDRGVTQIPHFCPLYHYDIFTKFGYDTQAARAACPNAEQAFFHEYTHLPLYGLPADAVAYMIESVRDAAQKLKR